MTIWLEIPAMLEVQSDEELERMNGVCRDQRIRFARGPAKEREDANRMLAFIVREQRIRRSGLISKAIQ